MNVSEKEKMARFYFSHNIIDKYKLYRLAEFTRLFLYEGRAITFSSKYLDFIEFIKIQSEKNKHILQNYIPTTEVELKPVDSTKILAEFQIDNKKSSLDLTILTIYLISNMYFKENPQINVLTGSLIENIAEFDGFNSLNTIGDMHSTIPYSLSIDDDLATFSEKVYKIVELYAKGISFREMIFTDYPSYSRENEKYKKFWDKMNFSVNYIGEIKKCYV